MQVIGPTQVDQAQTLRQRAIAQGLQNIGNSIEGYYDNKRQVAETKRQQALKDAVTNLELGEKGYAGTVADLRAATDSGDPALIKAFSENRTDAYKNNQNQAKKDKELSNRKTMAEIRKLEREAMGGGQKPLTFKDQLAAAKQAKAMEDEQVALEVPGYGQARTKEEASNLRASMSDANEALAIIDKIKAEGKDVAFWDREKVNKINQLKTVLAGKLRLPLTGPGAMTEDEFQRLVGNIGDPSTVWGSESTEMAKLDQMKDILRKGVEQKFASSSRTPYTPKDSWADGEKKMALQPVNTRGGNPQIQVPFDPTRVPSVSPIQSAVANQAPTKQVRPEQVQKVKSMSDEDLMKFVYGN